MALHINVVGVREFEAAVQRMLREADAAALAITRESVALLERTAKGNFVGSHRRGEPHVGGDKPNVVTGNLRRSIRHDPIVRLGIASYGTRVGPSTVYARRIELGYNGGGGGPGHQTTRPFPYFEPAVRDTRVRMQLIAYEKWAAVF